MTPAFTTAEARRLRIEELVAEFTTPYSCCQPRVTNIQRGAELLDGTIVRPGARLSLNETLGPRTRGRGFDEAPMILRGWLVDAVGGGVSQLASTLYNAAHDSRSVAAAGNAASRPALRRRRLHRQLYAARVPRRQAPS